MAYGIEQVTDAIVQLKDCICEGGLGGGDNWQNFSPTFYIGTTPQTIIVDYARYTPFGDNHIWAQGLVTQNGSPPGTPAIYLIKNLPLFFGSTSYNKATGRGTVSDFNVENRLFSGNAFIYDAISVGFCLNGGVSNPMGIAPASNYWVNSMTFSFDIIYPRDLDP